MSQTSTDRSPPLLSQPPGKPARSATNALIFVFLAVQALLPLRYYLGNSRLDERFCWRFFSSVSLERHQVALSDTIGRELDPTSTAVAPAAPVPLAQLLQVGSIKKLVGTQHRDILEKFLRWRVSHPAVRQVRYERTTLQPDGTQRGPVTWTIESASGVIERVGPDE